MCCDRVVIPNSTSVITTVHGLRLRAGKVEARLCDRNSGSEEGSLFLRLRRVALEQSCGVEKDMKEASPEEGMTNGCPRTSLARVSSFGGSRSSIATGGVFGVDGEGDGDEDYLGDACGSRSSLSSVGSGGSGSSRASFSVNRSVANLRRVQGLRRSASWSVSTASASALATASSSVVAEYRLGRHRNPQLLDSTRPLVRARSARSIWASQGGGVPPDLHLLPSQDFIENLASLREGSGDETDREGERRALGDGNGTSFDESEEEEEEVVGDDVKGENDDDDIEVEGIPGRGKWNKELNAMTRAAWLGSKQASCGGFNSNASASSIPMSALASGSALASVQTDAPRALLRQTSPFHSRDPSEEEEEEEEGVVISGNQAGVSVGRVSGRGRGLAPALPPRQREQPPPPSPPPPAPISGDSSREAPASASDSAGTYGARGISGDRAAQEREGGRGSGVNEGRRVAGSDFLYRVMFDGLNVLVTLRIR